MNGGLRVAISSFRTCQKGLTMTATNANPSAGWRMKVAAFSLAVSIFAVLWFVVAALGTKFGLWPWQVGLGQMTFGFGPMITMGAIFLALVAQVISIIKAPRKQPFILSLAATLIAAMLLFRLNAMGVQSAALPPIHDIQTDWSDPIAYSDTMMTRRSEDGALNPVEAAPLINLPNDAYKARWPGMHERLVSEVQEEAEAKPQGKKATVYPTIEPLYFSAEPAAMADLVTRLIKKKSWELVKPAPENIADLDEFQIEATATSGWFGFKDDIAIRIRAVEGAVRVDMRSVSRVGLSDLGANSKRVAGFMNELKDRGNGRLAP